jgi:nitrogen fixation protein NifU and related proteins
MSDLRELYQSVILDHNNAPRNFREIKNATHQATGHNPLCGDELTLYAEIEGNQINDISFKGQGCAISQASASILTEMLKGQSLDIMKSQFKTFHALVKGESDNSEGLGKLAVFAGVREFPMRVKCATLSWHTLRGALAQNNELIRTE